MEVLISIDEDLDYQYDWIKPVSLEKSTLSCA